MIDVRTFWRDAQAKYAASIVDSHPPKRTKLAMDSDSESDVDPDILRRVLGGFSDCGEWYSGAAVSHILYPLAAVSKRFGCQIPVILQASDRVIKKMAKHHKRKWLPSLRYPMLHLPKTWNSPIRIAK